MLKIALRASAALLALGTSARAAESDSEFKLPHISVAGSASTELRPDSANLTLGVVTDRPIAAEAVSENAKSSAAVITDLKAQGIDPKYIRTESVRLEPLMLEERDPKTNVVIKRTLTGYRASNFVDVHFEEVERVGSVVSHLVERGANSFRGVSFKIKDRDARTDELRVKAVANAIHRAQLFAHGASMKLGRLLALEPEGGRNSGDAADLPTRWASREPQIVPIQVEPGLIRLDAVVTATWELVPE